MLGIGSSMLDSAFVSTPRVPGERPSFACWDRAQRAQADVPFLALFSVHHTGPQIVANNSRSGNPARSHRKLMLRRWGRPPPGHRHGRPSARSPSAAMPTGGAGPKAQAAGIAGRARSGDRNRFSARDRDSISISDGGRGSDCDSIPPLSL